MKAHATVKKSTVCTAPIPARTLNFQRVQGQLHYVKSMQQRKRGEFPHTAQPESPNSKGYEGHSSKYEKHECLQEACGMAVQRAAD
jgi:hypothetical protein